MAMVKMGEAELEKMCDIYCKFPDICTTQEMLDEKCKTCPLTAVTDKKQEVVS